MLTDEKPGPRGTPIPEPALLVPGRQRDTRAHAQAPRLALPEAPLHCRDGVARASLESDVLPVHADLEVDVIGDAVTEHSGSLRAAHRLVVDAILVALAVQLELPFASSLDPRVLGIERMGAVGTRGKENR